MVHTEGKVDSLHARRAASRGDRGEERRREIITAAIEAIEERGPNASTGDFASRAGLNRAHIYRHFASKEELDREVTLRLYREHKQRIREGIRTHETPMDAIRGPITRHVTWAHEHPNLFHFLVSRRYARTDDHPPRTESAFAFEIASAGEQYIPGFADHRDAADGFIIAVHGLIDASIQWWLDHPRETREQLIDRLSTQSWLLLRQRLDEIGVELDPRVPSPETPS
ncbi:TetR/AcrR family transcriptional regulator [Nocardia huaxiensis]|uniref:TetR/AcrR family transcriptional regulator n=1 Tax=Nocardia huaxiensis TaxID=2755382 RepID=UPI001E3A6FEC|nr:TetR/AcrR family transcriptional regulator [Nocardia huaxiensis]UFS97482.1 TetR/AcrR family transcriptional regulator [Nocardia huaxiensis]